MKSKKLFAFKELTDQELHGLMSQVAERVSLRQVTKVAPGVARGARNPVKGGVVSSSVLTSEARTAFVTSR